MNNSRKKREAAKKHNAEYVDNKRKPVLAALSSALVSAVMQASRKHNL